MDAQADAQRTLDQMKSEERQWQQEQKSNWANKYRRFSGKHMRGSYDIYARARRDPLNKDPSWGESVLKHFSLACDAKGLSAYKLFRQMDIDGDRTVSRPELNRLLATTFPEFSDFEFAAIFDCIDKDNSGEVSLDEFVHLLNIAKGKGKTLHVERQLRYRNPLYNVNRIAPAIVEGWDHLEEPPAAGGIANLARDRQQQIFGILEPSAKPPGSRLSKYQHFSGGFDAFARQEWRKAKHEDGENESAVPSLPDPGGITPRPGWCWSTTPALDGAGPRRKMSQGSAWTPRGSASSTPRGHATWSIMAPFAAS